MSLGRSSRFASLALLRKNLRKCCPPLHLHPPSPFIMVVWCVARILGTDVGKTLMNMEMLKFWRAYSDTRLYPRYQRECAFRLPSCPITIVSFPNWVCHFPNPFKRSSWIARSPRRSFLVVYPFIVIELSEDLESKDININMNRGTNVPMKGNWIKKIVLALCPLCLLTSRLESRDEILV